MIIFARDEDDELVIPVGLGPNVSEVQCPEPVLEDITLDSSTQGQTVTPDEGVDGFSGVTVNPYTTEARTAGITTNGTFTYSPVNADALSEVTVNVSVNTVHNQSKTADSSTVSQSITPDNGYTGLSSVTVNPYTLDSKTVDPSTSQQVVNSSADGLSSVTVNAVTSSIDSNIQAGNIKKDVSILGVVGTFEGGGGNDWLVDALAGNITDLSGHSLPAPTHDYQYYFLFANTAITSIPDISTWTSISGTYRCSYMFQNCTGLTTVSLPNITTVYDGNLYSIFKGCTNLTTVDLSGLTTYTGSYAGSWFNDCSSLVSVDLSSFDSISGSNIFYGGVFKNCPSLKTLKVGGRPLLDSDFLTQAYSIENLEVTTMANSGVRLTDLRNLTADSVLSVLTHLSPPWGNCYFYSGGLTVTDYPDGRIQTAYNAATAAGWTIYNLTITPYQ